MSKNEQPLTPAALYARVSSDRQDVDLSVAAQLRALRDYAEKNGYIVAREYVDEAESGRVADRPQFRRMLDDAGRPESPFEEILVWKFSRFTRKREHAVAFKAMLRRRGIRVVSITEHADDSPTGRLMEAIIESVDEFYSENLAQEVTRGMREAASRGFWITSRAPYGYRKVYVQDGAKSRARLELAPPNDSVVRRIFDAALEGRTSLEIARVLDAEGLASSKGRRWTATAVHKVLANEAYTGTLIWGATAKDGAPPVRVEDAFPAIVSRSEFERVAGLLASRSPKKMHPRRASSPYLLSGIAKCGRCGRTMTSADAHSGRYRYYVCHSLIKHGKGSCDTPRLNARRFERLIIDQIRENVLTESNIRELVKILDEEMDAETIDQRRNLETIEKELAEVRRKLDRVWHIVETTDLGVSDAATRIQDHRERQQRLEKAAEETRTALAQRRAVLDSADTIAAFAEDMSEFLKTSEIAETRAFVRSFVEEVAVEPGKAVVRYTIPTPYDSPLRGSDNAEIEFEPRFMATGIGGGAEGIRTPDLINAIDALSQLSYSPTVKGWAWRRNVKFTSSLRRVAFNSNALALNFRAPLLWAPFLGHRGFVVEGSPCFSGGFATQV